MIDLGNARAWTRELWDRLPAEGGKVIDATVGNGYDTLYLAGLILDSHENMDIYVSEPVDGVVFNLGWLPGAEHAVTTHAESTLKAVGKCLALLKKGGLMTICVYPGHPEGEKEKNALLEWASALDDSVFDARITAYLNINKRPPLLIAITRR